jgi:hypothetical protein
MAHRVWVRVGGRNGMGVRVSAAATACWCVVCHVSSTQSAGLVVCVRSFTLLDTAQSGWCTRSAGYLVRL